MSVYSKKITNKFVVLLILLGTSWGIFLYIMLTTHPQLPTLKEREDKFKNFYFMGFFKGQKKHIEIFFIIIYI